jgi:hypothetical protein
MKPAIFKIAILKSAFALLLLAFGYSHAQNPSGDVYVDSKGVMRWTKGKKEVQGFGVNYTTPFAHAYRTAKRKGIDLKKAIDEDVYHFSRLGFDLYRVHVWDTEISDTLGNLLDNEHLELFDYLLMKLSERNINYVITPIAFWDNGYPEPADNTPGFSKKYGKGDCLTNVDCIKAQENYLYQFLNHKNRYTGLVYKNDPRVIAFEVSNEPHHGGEAKDVTAFVKKMVASMRKTGTKKPIFYNISHSVHFAEAYFKGGIQGGTFQWYPTGLGYAQSMGGNLLPNVDDYNIPFDDVIQKNKGAKLVYEFDAAAVGKSYIYPAIARSFRTAGIQIATHFAYDPTFMADVNTEYNTHYMNLAYAPSKALSLMIAAEVFHEVPLYKNYGSYPLNANFDNFKIDYENDLAEFQSDNKFIYTNNTSSELKNPEKIETIAGFGNSSAVQYSGRGAYFLDKIEDGLWRLEVMPDAVWIDNVFGRNSPKKKVAVIKWNEWPIKIKLSGLGSNFHVKGINTGNNKEMQAAATGFSVTPGTYLLAEDKSKIDKTPIDQSWNHIKLNEYIAPADTVDKTYVIHHPSIETSANQSLNVKATIVSDKKIKAKLIVFNGRRPQVLDMENREGYDFETTIPAENVREGNMNYYLEIQEGEDFRTFPADKIGQPFDWDFFDRTPYTTRVVAAESPIYLFDAHQHSDLLMQAYRRGNGLKPLSEPGKAEYEVNIEKLYQPDAENLNEEKIYDYSFKYFFRDDISGRLNDLSAKKKLVFRGKSLNDKPEVIQLAFTMLDGTAYGGLITLYPEKKDYSLEFSDLKQVKAVTLPRPYPSFLPYYYTNPTPKPFDINNVESIQVSIGPGIPTDQLEKAHGFAVESVWVE